MNKGQIMLLALATLFSSSHVARANQVIGWIEYIGIQPQGIVMEAKIDTGADNSSVHAEDVRIDETNGKQMVTFTLRNKKGEEITLHKPLMGYADIKRRGNAEPLRRPVVQMELCIGNEVSKVNVNLADRENFRYRMLVGRSYLKKGYVVDSNRKHTSEPGCKSGTIAGN
jgi:hypothetical protein